MKKTIATAATCLMMAWGLTANPLLAADQGQTPEEIVVPPIQVAQADTSEVEAQMAILPEAPQPEAPANNKALEEKESMAIIPGAADDNEPVMKPRPPEEPEIAVKPPQAKQQAPAACPHAGQGQAVAQIEPKPEKIRYGNPSAYLDVPEEEERYRGRTKYVPGHYRVYNYLPDATRSASTEVLLSEMSREVAGKVYYGLKDDGSKHHTARVAIVAAVPLADLKRETEFGRISAEYLLTDLADRGIKVSELRLGREINILAQTGEFILSRNISELANNNQELDYVVVSTFSNTRKTLILHGRLVSLQDGIIKSSWRYTLPLNRELLGLFHTIEKPYTIAVKGMVE